MANIGQAPPARAGRRRATSREELERVAFALFADHGFDATTVDDIARAAGIGRRTFFRYFESKNDVVWALSIPGLDLMRARLRARPGGIAAAVRATLAEGTQD
ncbi:TetR family transcriptional regulator, partial [Saccharomonospora saliphila]|uniref:TetR family transcriptional regulator n=1 Tax=Saccharomonospora saliphila TaxID=369829 RepID=UPI00036D8AFC